MSFCIEISEKKKNRVIGNETHKWLLGNKFNKDYHRFIDEVIYQL